jgi:hypothetical protein
MWLWDSNILRYYFGEKHPILHLHLKRISRDEIALKVIPTTGGILNHG